MLGYIRSYLGLKLFFSYLVVIVMGVVAAMGSMMAGMMSATSQLLDQSLFTNFQAAVSEALTMAALAATVTAVIASIFISRQVVAPVQAMMVASRRVRATSPTGFGESSDRFDHRPPRAPVSGEGGLSH